VPLSEHEQRLFEQIERSLAEDPKFASAVRASDPRFHARRRVLVAVALVVAGLGFVVYGTASKSVPVAVVGFVVMLGAAGFALTSLRRAAGGELRAVGGTASRPTRRRSSFIDRLEERWRQRPEDGRQ
jgi:hypothetical protein